VAYAVANGIFGSIDANRGDPQNGWDTDQFPNSVDEMSLALYEIVKGGGFTTGGFNFDTKLRRQSIDRADLFHGHVGGIDTLARSLLVAADMTDQETLSQPVADRYRGWTESLGQGILDGSETLATLEKKVSAGDVDPSPVSGRQELLENKVNEVIWSVEA
jgi:xylose isomerase